METGWISEEPDVESPAMPLSGIVLATKQHDGDTLAIALARSQAADRREAREREAGAVDPDARAAEMIARGVLPGQMSGLAQRLGDTLAELAAEREKIERGQRRQEQVVRAHQNGQITAFDIARMDFDEGDPGAVARLERRAGSLQRQIREASEAMAPQRTPEDPLEAASRRARQAGHEAFREVTRQRMTEAEAGVRRPPFFAGRGVAVRSEVTCADCIKYGATPEQSFLIHQDPDAPIESEFVGLSEQVVAAFGREDQASAERWTYGHAEIAR